MNGDGFHRVADELRPGWLEGWATQGIAELEAFLAEHASFSSSLDGE